MISELETGRLLLRQMRESDHDDFARNYADPDLTRFLDGPVTPATFLCAGIRPRSTAIPTP